MNTAPPPCHMKTHLLRPCAHCGYWVDIVGDGVAKAVNMAGFIRKCPRAKRQIDGLNRIFEKQNEHRKRNSHH